MRAQRQFATLVAVLLQAGCGLLPASSSDSAPEEHAAAIAALESDDWSRRPEDMESAGGGAGFRWRHPTVHALVLRGSDSLPLLEQASEHSSPIVRSNAAIALARLGDTGSHTALHSAVLDSSLSPSLRAAAAEALAYGEPSGAAPRLRPLLAKLQDAGSGSHEQAPVRAELIRGLARHSAASREPLLAKALLDQSEKVRLAAVRAWEEPTAGPLPEELLARRDDTRPAVRRAVVRVLAVRRPPTALANIARALKDRDVNVRREAVRALGRLDSEQSRALLEQLVQEGGEREAVEAVIALSRLGRFRSVEQAASDPRWRVRRAAAVALADLPQRSAVAVMGDLVTDRSIEVQTTALASLESWPDPLAVSLLLDAMEAGGYRTRAAAHDQLQRRLGRKIALSVDRVDAKLRERVAQLRREWKSVHGLVDPKRVDTESPPSLAAAPDPALVTMVAVLMDQLGSAEPAARRRAVDELKTIGPDAVPAIERWAEDRPRPLPSLLLDDVLPQLSPTYRALSEFATAEGAGRRSVASQLSRLVEGQPLSPLAAEQLVTSMATEEDPLVWRIALGSLVHDATDASRQAFRLALNNPNDEVRRAACELLVRYPQVGMAPWLVPRLKDANPAVRRIAAEALGVAGDPSAAPALERLLVERSRETRLAAAKALCLLGSPVGRDELTRLAHDTDATVRRDAAAAMAACPEEQFLPVLIALLDDARGGVRRAALESLEKLAGSRIESDDSGIESDDSGPPRTSREQIARWKRWWAARSPG